ncbi:Peptidase U4, sporulation factor SpoIIGA [Moorella glycerini]|uniref:Sporulation sigma-E factor-processing peptidase n=1 Tax=Neomoorella stamsii TaxID=1266720 RepID=A0A9X7P5T6_9FIRM|nr:MULTISPECIES: sigma-E processing peptidase SpoIIGA [Moorella]PRR72203.1 Sporulation factor SpoIIGA [Moorella stamsii]CEP69504.1 Peptidase U4, sporulation factor SpoIIGA [Moorella glycerini]
MVYLDVLLAINLVMDYLILWTTARLGQLATTGWRLLAGAAVGAVYSLAILFPGGEWEQVLLVKILFSVIMVLVAFFPLNGQRFLQALVYFYLAAFAMGGAMLGAIYLASGEAATPVIGGTLVLVHNIRYTWLLVAVAAAGMLAVLGTGWLKKNFWQQVLRLPVIITFAGRQRALKALVDTGNSLRDPLTQRPVIIVEYSALKGLLPEEIIKHYSSQEEPDLESLVKSLASSPWVTRLRLLPYHSLGQSQGMLLGLRPDEVIVITNERMIKIKDVIVGLYRERLSPEGNYRALLHPDLLQLSMGL